MFLDVCEGVPISHPFQLLFQENTMSKLETLRGIKTKHELSALLGIKTSALTYTLYILKPDTQYSSFTLEKRSGGERTIFAPSERLKSIQSTLSELLQDCRDEINAKKQGSHEFKSTLSHGFVRKHSIITNAMMHLNQKNVLNIDLENFFDCFNFGRVRGFFIANNNFKLDPHIATVIAQISCHENKLPQGSPCSPIISNLITHSLDIRLAHLANTYSCKYTRYADDITISTRENVFPAEVMSYDDGAFIAGKRLKREIKRAGFSINEKKTRIQYRDSRQDVTGLIVNKKPNTKSEYWRTVKSQCHALFSTGSFKDKKNGNFIDGNENVLEGRLNFIDQIDRFNRLRQKEPLNPDYALAKHGYNTFAQLSGRERTFSRFLYYKFFYGNKVPTILCEGKTDNIYLKCAIHMLARTYPQLAKEKKEKEPYELLVTFFKYTKRTRFLLQLHGGTSYLSFFISAFDKHYNFYKAPKPDKPVIIIADNDSGFNSIEGKLRKIDSAKGYHGKRSDKNFRNAEFIHVLHNLYIILTPTTKTNSETAIEDLFDDSTRRIKVSGKSFNPSNGMNNDTEYGKEIFAKKVIRAQKGSINFSGFTPLLDRIVAAMDHYDANK